MRVGDENVEKTMFHTCYGGYEFVAKPFGLTNAQATIMELMNRVCDPMIDRPHDIFY